MTCPAGQFAPRDIHLLSCYDHRLLRRVLDQLFQWKLAHLVSSGHRHRPKLPAAVDRKHAAKAPRYGALIPQSRLPSGWTPAVAWARIRSRWEPLAFMTQIEPVPGESGSPQSPTHSVKAIFLPSGENFGLDS